MPIGSSRAVWRGGRPLSAACLFVLAIASAWAVSEGDTLAQVLTQKGKPKTKVTAGAMEVLSYPDAVIKLKDGVVVSVRVQAPPRPSPAPRPAAASPTVSAASPAQAAKGIPALRQELEGAVARVIEIVNQPVPFVQRTRNMDTWGMLFHDGATRPDFGSVDVRKTQEEPPTMGHEYTMFDAHPNIAWRTSDIEFNPMTKYFYQDRTVPKKRLTEDEMIEINKLYGTIARCEQGLARQGYDGTVP